MQRISIVPALCVALVAAGSALAAGTEPDPLSPAEVRRELTRAQAYIDDGQYRRAVSVLNDVTKSAPDNADAHNLLGFSYRKMEDFARAERYYNIALKHDPMHRGALEYAGEMYLQTGRRGEAERMMARLEKACPSGCEELDALRAAISGSAKNW